MKRIAKHYQFIAILLVLLLLTSSFVHAQGNVPERLTYEYVKNHYAGKKTVDIPYGVKIVDGFQGNKVVESITIPSSVKEIKSWAFDKCTSLKQVKIPSSVTKIGQNSFFGCDSLKEIIIPSSVTAIESRTFGSCYLLRKVTLPKNLKIIGRNAFSSCSSLQEITIPSTVTTIEEYAFSDSGLERIVIPRSVGSVGRGAFNECKRLREALVPASLAKNFSKGNPIFQYSWQTKITIYDVNGKKWEDDSWYWKCPTELYAEEVRRELSGTSKKAAEGARNSSIDPNTVSIPRYEDECSWHSWTDVGPEQVKDIRFSTGMKIRLFRVYDKARRCFKYWPFVDGIDVTRPGWKTEEDAAAAGYVCRKYGEVRSVGRFLFL